MAISLVAGVGSGGSEIVIDFGVVGEHRYSASALGIIHPDTKAGGRSAGQHLFGAPVMHAKTRRRAVKAFAYGRASTMKKCRSSLRYSTSGSRPPVSRTIPRNVSLDEYL